MALTQRSLKCMETLVEVRILGIICPFLCCNFALLSLPSLYSLIYMEIPPLTFYWIIPFHRLVPILTARVAPCLHWYMLQCEKVVPTSFGFCWRLEQILIPSMMHGLYFFLYILLTVSPYSIKAFGDTIMQLLLSCWWAVLGMNLGCFVSLTMSILFHHITL